MSEIFFQDIDDGIGFGIQTCNVADVALFSSTGYDARILLFTANNGTPGLEYINVGSAFGTSNYATNAQNEIYIGHVTQQSNVQKVIVIHDSNVGINTPYPTASLQITSPLTSTNDAFLINTLNGTNFPTFRVRNDGLVGVGTDPVTGNTMTVKGALQVDSLTIGGNVSLGNAALITAAGLVTGGGYGYSNYLQFGNNSFCNVSTIKLDPNGKIITDTISSLTQSKNNISFTTASINNIGNIYTNPSSILTIDSIKSATNSNTNSVYIPLINSSNTVTSNLTAYYVLADTIRAATNTNTNSVIIPLVSSTSIVTNNLTATQLLGNLNVNNNSLCNVQLLDVANISNRINSQINFANNSLNNIAVANISTTNASTVNANYGNISNLAVTTLASLVPGSAINVQSTPLNNVGNVTLTSSSTLNTNSINNTGTQSYINFNNSSVTNISNLTVNGTFTIPGEVIITNTSINVTEQLSVQNNGTGPTLMVNQTSIGTSPVSQFMFASNVVLMIKNGGQTLVGDFGTSQNAITVASSGTLPKAQLYITNPSYNVNQDAVYIQQPLTGNNILTLQGTSPIASNSIYFTASGKMAMGLPTITTAPNARIQVAQQNGDTTDYLRLTSTGAVASNANAFVVTSTGRVGVSTDPLSATYASSTAKLIVAGTIQADNLILGNSGGGAGATNLITAYGMTPPSGTSYLNFGATNMSNINVLTATQLQTTGLGSASVPAYAFTKNTSPANAGTFAPLSNMFAIATAGVERLRVDANGNVGIGSTQPQYKLDIGTGSIGAGSFTGSGSNISNINASALSFGTVPIGQLPIASTTAQGITQLTNSVISTSTTTAATANSVFLANSNASTRISRFGDTMSGNLQVNATLTANYFSGDGSNMSNLNASALSYGVVSVARLPVASLTGFGATKLVDSVSCNSTLYAATPNSVFLANSNATTRISRYGDTMIGNLNVNATLTATYFSGDGSNINNINAGALAYGVVPVAQLPVATLGGFGATQLVDSVSCNSIDFASTPNSVYLANSNADTRISRYGDSMDGDLQVNGTLTATYFSGDGSSLINLNASSLVSGEVPVPQLPVASLTGFGVTQLVTSVSCNSIDFAATPNCVFLANSNATTRISRYGDTMIGNLQVNATLTANYFSGDGSNITNINAGALTYGVVPVPRLPVALVTGYGATKLVDSVSCNSTIYAATPNSVFLANSNANTRISRFGDTLTGNLQVNGTLTSTFFSGNGSNMSNLNASALAFGVVPVPQLPIASLTGFGATQLVDSVSCNSTLAAATPNSVFLANSNANTRISRYGDTLTGDLIITSNLTVNNTLVAGYFSGDGGAITNLQTSQLVGVISTANLPVASTTSSGITQLSDSVTSSDSTTAATSYAVTSANTNANSRILRAGDNMTGDLSILAKLNAYNVGIGSTLTGTQASTLSVGGGMTLGTSFNSVYVPDGSLVTSGYVGIGTSNPQYELDVFGTLRVTGTTIFDADVLFDDIIISSVTAVASASNTVDFTGINTSNINTINANNLYISKITSGSATSTSNVNGPIDFTGSILCNITNVKTASLITPSITSTTNQVSFGYNKVLDVDSLIVRSNITVTFTGLNTYTNLPTNVVKLDDTSGKILDQYISSNIARLMSDGTLNPALIPVQQLPQSTLVRSTDKVGVGTRFPAQKLHVNNGNLALTGGRLGIGTSSTPLGALYIYDQNSGVPSLRVDNSGSYDTVNINGPNNTPLFYITANCNVGINTAAPQYTLDVNGTTHTNGLKTNTITSDTGTIDCALTSFTNMQNLNVANLNVSTSISLPATITSAIYTDTVNTTQVYTDFISTKTATNLQITNPVHITGYDTSLYTTPINIYGTNTNQNQIGLRIEKNIMARSLLTISDKRVKNNINDSDINTDLNSVLQIPVHKYNFIDRPPPYNKTQTTGFIAQEIESIVPDAIDTITNAIPSIMRICKFKTPSIIYYDIESVNDNSSVNNLLTDSQIKLIHSGKEIIRTITNIIKIDTTVEIYLDIPIELDPSDPTDATETIKDTLLLYGIIVNDFKLINNERLMPLVFNAVKALYSKLQYQETTINDILLRLTNIEQK